MMPAKNSLEVAIGNEMETFIEVKNPGAEAATFSISAQGSASNLVSLAQTQVNLAPGQSIKVKVTINGKDTYSPGKYDVNFIIKTLSGEVISTTPMQVTVVEQSGLLVRLKSDELDSYKPGQAISYALHILVLGNSSVQAKLNVSLFNASGAQIAFATQTLQLHGNTTFNGILPLPSNTLPGTYRFKATLDYFDSNSSRWRSLQTEQILKVQQDQQGDWLIWAAALLLIAMVAAFFAYRKFKSKQTAMGL